MNARHIKKKKSKFSFLAEAAGGRGAVLACYVLCSHPGVALQAAAMRSSQELRTLSH